MKASETILLTRKQVAELLTLDECMAAVEEAFRLYGSGKAASPGVLGTHTEGGGFHVKTSLLDLGRRYYALKVNANFFNNSERFGLPNIQGLIMLCDGVNGYPLAVMDSIEITILRTGAATAVAARYLARRDSETVTICGCGNQGRVQLAAIAKVLPIKRVFAFDLDAKRAQQFSREMSEVLGMEVSVVQETGAGVRHSDACITCTPSRLSCVSRTSTLRSGHCLRSAYILTVMEVQVPSAASRNSCGEGPPSAPPTSTGSSPISR